MTTTTSDLTRRAVAASNALTARWAAELPDRATVIAGAGLWPLLAILAASADGKAATELSEAAGVSADDGFAASAALIDLLSSLPSTKAALGVWVHRRAPLHAEWRDALPAHTVSALLGDGSDQARVDAWASEQTDGVIARMPVVIDRDTLILLATAIMVRTKWVRPFDVTSVSFSRAPGAPGAAEGSHALQRRHDDPAILHISDTGAITMVEVEGDQGISVHLVIGEVTAPAADVLVEAMGCLGDPARCRDAVSLREGDSFPGGTVTRVASATPEPTLVLTTVPFDIATDHDLLDHASSFGLTTAMDSSRGHFPRVSNTPLAIQQARQQARAAFTAEGFEAAAVTAMGMMSAGMRMLNAECLQIRVTFDRPFGFLAVDRSTGLVLVAGWVTKPQAGDG